MTELLAYHAPDVLFEGSFRYRRPRVLAAGAACVGVGGLAIGLGWQSIGRRAGLAVPVSLAWLTAGCLVAAAGVYLLSAFAAGRVAAVRVTTDGVECPGLRPWSAIARVGGSYAGTGVRLELTTVRRTVFGPVYGRRTIRLDRPFDRAEFESLLDRVANAGGALVHVWVDRHVERLAGRSGVSLRVLAELESRRNPASPAQDMP